MLSFCPSTARNQRMAKSGENIFQIINYEQQCNLGWTQEQQEKHHWHLIISLKDVELQVQGKFRKILAMFLFFLLSQILKFFFFFILSKKLSGLCSPQSSASTTIPAQRKLMLSGLLFMDIKQKKKVFEKYNTRKRSEN